MIGHSIGAEMAVHAMHTLGTERVSRVVGLMPFLLVNRDSRLQKFLSALVHIRPLVHLVAAVVGFIRGAGWWCSTLNSTLFDPWFERRLISTTKTVIIKTRNYPKKKKRKNGFLKRVPFQYLN